VNAIEDKIEAARRRKEAKLKKNAAKSKRVGEGHQIEHSHNTSRTRTRPNSDIAPKVRRKKMKSYNKDIEVENESYHQ